MNKNIFTVKEVSVLLKVTQNTVLNLIHNNTLEHFKIRGKTRISEEQLDAYLESVKIQTKNQMAAN